MERLVAELHKATSTMWSAFQASLTAILIEYFAGIQDAISLHRTLLFYIHSKQIRVCTVKVRAAGNVCACHNSNEELPFAEYSASYWMDWFFWAASISLTVLSFLWSTGLVSFCTRQQHTGTDFRRSSSISPFTNDTNKESHMCV